MTNKKIEDDIIAEVAKLFTVQHSELNKDTHFIKDLAATSNRMFALACIMEELFDIEITYAQVNSFNTVGDAITFIEANAG